MFLNFWNGGWGRDAWIVVIFFVYVEFWLRVFGAGIGSMCGYLDSRVRDEMCFICFGFCVAIILLQGNEIKGCIL